VVMGDARTCPVPVATGTGGTDSSDREQPDRLHHLRPARHALHALLHRRREDGRGADLPRESATIRRRCCS
jgi:hypothetical protein